MEGQWTPEDNPDTVTEPGKYVQQLWEQLEAARAAAHANLEQAQATQKRCYDQGARRRSFHPGAQVLVSNAALARPHGDPWQGPFVVHRVLGSETYEL